MTKCMCIKQGDKQRNSAQLRLQSLGNTNSAKTPRGHSELEKKPKTEASRPKGTQKQIAAALLTGSIHNT